MAQIFKIFIKNKKPKTKGDEKKVPEGLTEVIISSNVTFEKSKQIKFQCSIKNIRFTIFFFVSFLKTQLIMKKQIMEKIITKL